MIDKFLDSMRNRDISNYTIIGYKTDVYQFRDWFNRTIKKEMDVINITPLDIKEYKLHLEGKRLKPGTINRKLNSLKTFFGWCVKQGIIASSPVRVDFVKQVERGVKWLTRQDTFALLRAIEEKIVVAEARGNEKATTVARRNAATVALMLHAGLRVSEVRDLLANDVILGSRSGKVIVRRGKGGKYREIPLNRDARSAIQEWLAVKPGNSDLFLDERLHVRTIQYHLKRLAAAANLDNLTPHQLRHTFGKNLVDAGVSIDRVAKLMGHSDVNITAIYTQPSETDLQSAVERISWYD